jgi:predicted DNA-binding transcriptional regulator AlpA
MSIGNRIRLKARAAAEELCVSRSTLAKWRMKHVGPPYHRCGPRIVFYYRDEIETWLADCDRRDRAASPH